MFIMLHSTNCLEKLVFITKHFADWSRHVARVKNPEGGGRQNIFYLFPSPQLRSPYMQELYCRLRIYILQTLFFSFFHLCCYFHYFSHIWQLWSFQRAAHRSLGWIVFLKFGILSSRSWLVSKNERCLSRPLK